MQHVGITHATLRKETQFLVFVEHLEASLHRSLLCVQVDAISQILFSTSLMALLLTSSQCSWPGQAIVSQD